MGLEPFEEAFKNFCRDWHKCHSALCYADGLAQRFEITVFDIAQSGLHIAGCHLIFVHHM